MSIEESYQKFLIEFNNHLSSIKQKATLVGVSKTKPLDDIVALYKLGLRDFGENYAQELRDKIKDTIEEYKDIKWHYIGNIQENKIKYVAGKAHLIHTVDTLKKAEAINAYCLKHKVIQSILIQVNVSKDPNKAGTTLDQTDDLYKNILTLEAIKIRGLMTITKYSQDPEFSREDYRKMKKLALTLENIYGRKLELSMGMSNDYKVALEEGATIVRVGTKIFGERV